MGLCLQRNKGFFLLVSARPVFLFALCIRSCAMPISNGRRVVLEECRPKECKNGTVCIEERTSPEIRRFQQMADEGCELLLPIMAFMIGGDAHRALEIIGRGQNYQKVSFALAGFFCAGNYAENPISLAVFKSRGYQLLRDMVKTCAVGVRVEDQSFPHNYNRLVDRLFKSQGLPTP